MNNDIPDNHIPRLFVERMVEGVRHILDMGEADCYPSVSAEYIEGQNLQTIQIIPGSMSQDTTEEGGQMGGSTHCRMTIDLAYWLRLHTDMHDPSENALIDAADGVLDTMTKLRNGFALTTLGGILLEPLRWENESDTTMMDADKSIFLRKMTFSGCWREANKSTITLDLPHWHNEA